MHTGQTDNELIQQVLQGHTAAFAVLVERYQAFVFTLVLRYVKSREDAEEVAQDAFVKAFRSLSDFRGASKFSTWLFTVATTTSLTFLRKKKLEVQSLDNEKVFAAADTIDSGARANEIETKSRHQMVQQAIGMLGPDDSRILLLFYKGEQTLEEIAQILGKEPNAVKVQLHRARGRLKEKMQTHFPEEVRNLYNG
ncbi:MAG TPA: sigma-70 family RNA polymerase sigma factor [Chitinophagaceae bacterium]|jgi:RNA polymerase sigma-70 factor (ECF subfamily)|nr:sigma-70 family RNA polymerase sigma factor [Chitinophagaceae bacterium]